MGDAIHDRTTDLFLIGGQFVSHPPGSSSRFVAKWLRNATNPPAILKNTSRPETGTRISSNARTVDQHRVSPGMNRSPKWPPRAEGVAAATLGRVLENACQRHNMTDMMRMDETHRKGKAPGDRPFRPTRRSLPIALLRARETVMGPLREMLAQTPINEQKWRVLRVLDEDGPMEQTAIADAACLLLPSLSRILRSMEEEGLLTRTTDAADRRKSIVTISDAGRQLILDHAAQSNAILQRLEDGFGREKLETLLDLLEDLRKVPL